MKLFRPLRSSTPALEATLCGALGAKDRATLAHVERVVGYARAICAGMAAEGYPAELPCVEVLRRAALFHDLGKIAVEDGILTKPGALDDREHAAMRLHPEAGRALLRDFGDDRLADARVLEGVLHHHERWDGEGYPAGLRQSQIPLLARIIAVADAFDAMTSDRPYRGRLPHEDARREIERCRGTQFDPDVVDGFLRSIV
jgi:HD-GYP domain-containing protein (c-di-GMP phosphodiesterase class II)